MNEELIEKIDQNVKNQKQLNIIIQEKRERFKKEDENLGENMSQLAEQLGIIEGQKRQLILQCNNYCDLFLNEKPGLSEIRMLNEKVRGYVTEDMMALIEKHLPIQNMN